MQEKDNLIKARYQLLATKIIKNLQSRNFEAYYCDNAEDATKKALSLIPENSSVSWGGSVTLKEIGLIDKIYQGNFTIIDRDKAKTKDEVNVDSVGNRVAAITFGPKSVIAVIGMNKVCKTRENAIDRARTHASPINALRCSSDPFLNSPTNTPCVINGSCGNCKSKDCICSYIVETRMCKTEGRIKVILVGESLGF